MILSSDPSAASFLANISCPGIQIVVTLLCRARELQWKKCIVQSAEKQN